MTMNMVVERGFKGFPDCDSCQCYPECRNDCPDHLKCVERLPEYGERVFGPDKETWPAKVREEWDRRGYTLWADKPKAHQFTKLDAKGWWEFWK